MNDETQDRSRLAMKAISARARGDWQAERDALDAIHLLDREDES